MATMATGEYTLAEPEPYRYFDGDGNLIGISLRFFDGTSWSEYMIPVVPVPEGSSMQGDTK